MFRQQQTKSDRRRRRASLLRVKTWSVAAKIIALCVGIAVAVALGLTALGYTAASHGLRQQAEAALWSDGLLVSNQVDAWNAKRLSDVQSLAMLPSVSRVLEAGANAGWAADLAAGHGLTVLVANTNGEAWKFQHLKRKTDRDDALRLAELAALGQLPTVALPPPATRQCNIIAACATGAIQARNKVATAVRTSMAFTQSSVAPRRSPSASRCSSNRPGLLNVGRLRDRPP